MRGCEHSPGCELDRLVVNDELNVVGPRLERHCSNKGICGSVVDLHVRFRAEDSTVITLYPV